VAVVRTAAAVTDQLATRAAEKAGLDDFGPDSWQEGLGILVESIEACPDASAAGRDAVYDQYVDALWNRLRVVDYAKGHPEVLDAPVERPLVVIGLPRTGTTVASYLLDEDRVRRSLLKWEAVDSVPPPTTATLRSDPRCLKLKARLDEMAAARQRDRIPIPHWEEADGPTECCFVHGQDFRSLLWESAMPTPVYSDWYLDADVTCTYEYEQTVLRILQSQAPGTWSLKLPSHSLHLDALLGVFPDARIVWAHRDPFRATASYLAMNQLGRPRIAGPGFDIRVCVPWVLEQLRASVDRPRQMLEQLGDDRFFHLHYAELMRDPVGQMRDLYRWAGDELSDRTEQAMRGWLERNPRDRFGSRPYSLDEFGLTQADLEPVFADYLDAFEVELEKG
jgi:hypothetical protein